MNILDTEIIKSENVAVIRMNNKKENSFSPELLDAFLTTLDEIEKNDDVRAVVLTGGSEKFFSTGLDLAWLKQNSGNPKAILGYLKKLNQVYVRWTLFPKPTVAALNGHTFAGGFFLAAHLDFRFMRADRGFICIPEVNINIPLLPGMVAICEAVMPPQSFRKLYYTGDRFGGVEAKKLGFADEIFSAPELLPEAIAFASKLGKAKTATYAEMKRRIRQHVVDTIEKKDPKLFFSTLQYSM